MSDIISVTIAIPANKLGALYAAVAGLLGTSVSAAAISPGNSVSSGGSVSTATPPSSAAPATPESGASVGTGPSAPPPASPSDGTEVDAAGVPWTQGKHAATKTKTKAGLWRMAVGVNRPENESESSPNYIKPGESAPSAPAAGSSASPPPPPAMSAPAAAEDDEFAAFRNAATASPPPPPAGARTWTDADLSKLCNQAALASGSPDKVKEIIAKYVGNEVAHSRNIPNEQRENFAQEVELAFGIQYANG